MIRPDVVTVRATEEDVVRWYGPIYFGGQWTARVMKKGSLVVGFGGFIELEPGTWFAFFEVPSRYRKPLVLRHIRDAMNEAIGMGAEVIKAYCDTSIPRAEALMHHLGFVETDELLDDKVIWKWGS